MSTWATKHKQRKQRSGAMGENSSQSLSEQRLPLWSPFQMYSQTSPHFMGLEILMGGHLFKVSETNR